MSRDELERRAEVWRRHYRRRTLLVAVSVGCAAAASLVRISVFAAIGVGLVVTLITAMIRGRRCPRVTAEMMAAHFNRECPALEESAGLWLRDPGSFSLVETLQRRRLDAAWKTLADRDRVGMPDAAPVRAAALCASGMLAVLLVMAAWPQARRTEFTESRASANPTLGVVPPTLRAASIHVQPPAYLGQPTRQIAGLNGEAPHGAALEWAIEIDGNAKAVALEFTGGRGSLTAAMSDGGRVRLRSIAEETLLYQVVLTRGDGERVVLPEVHTLKVVPDQAPRIAWLDPMQSRTLVDPTAKQGPIRLSVVVSDDHAVAESQLMATVAKGSGEGVKFREQPLEMTRTGGTDREAVFTRDVDLPALGMEPGDELYVYAVARDRREPVANVGRSETRFLVWRGPESEVADPAARLAGVNRMPQYFRSQRQLIIDTERLLSERPQLDDEQFRARAEEIGVDQKLLRLRYGQFLGEEFEATTAGAPREAEAMAYSARLRARGGPEPQRSGAIERAIEQQHQHPEPARVVGEPQTAAEMMARFAHVHDNPEAATLFDLEVKASLRGVLAAMWEAEGFLRTGRPAEALPAENRALELLKAMQQADRVYVKRVGFEPAPLKVDERRLRGELGQIPRAAQSTLGVTAADAEIAAVRTVLAADLAQVADRGTDETRGLVERLLTTRAREEPEVFVPALELWRSSSAVWSQQDRTALRRALLLLLPAGKDVARRQDENLPEMARRYRDELSAERTAP